MLVFTPPAFKAIRFFVVELRANCVASVCGGVEVVRAITLFHVCDQAAIGRPLIAHDIRRFAPGVSVSCYLVKLVGPGSMIVSASSKGVANKRFALQLLKCDECVTSVFVCDIFHLETLKMTSKSNYPKAEASGHNTKTD